MRRLVLTLACAASLLACASILGDFNVVPDGGDGASSGNVPTDGALPTGDGGVQPVPVEVAVNQLASCATVKYGAARLITLCWGATNPDAPPILGVTAADPKIAGVFSAPHVPGTTNELVLDPPISTGSGLWFMAASTDGSQGASAKNAYAWGVNTTAETGADAGTATLPHVLRENGDGTALAFTSAAGGQHHGCLVTSDTNGKLYCWGQNDECQATTGTSAGCIVPTNPIPHPEQIASSSLPRNEVPVRVAVGQTHTCLVTHTSLSKAGSVYCWGGNASQQAGQTASPSVSVPANPVNVPTGRDVTKMEVAAGDTHSCALIEGELWCWGDNSVGQVAPGGGSAPRLGNKLNAALFNGDLSMLTLGGTATCAVVTPTTGKSHAYCFGTGPLGRSPDRQNDAVAPVAAIEDIQRLAMSNTHGCAIARPAGGNELGLYCWGKNQAHAVDPHSNDAEIDQPRRVLFPTF